MSEIIETPTYCAIHLDRETALRCNKCDRYMCTQCAVRTPVGYRCRECTRQHEDKFFTASMNDYLIIAGACAVMGAVGGGVMRFMPLGFYLAFFIGAPAGAMIAQIALYLTFKRRGRYSAEVAAASIALGALVGSFFNVTNIGLLIFIGTAASAAYARYKMRFQL
jgi:hypothetical protein